MSKDAEKLVYHEKYGNETRAQKLARLELLEKKLALKDGLPHLYGFPHYKWSRAFFESRNKNCFLTAANQIGKSSVQIRKMIHWATDEKIHKELWPRRPPKQFWYFYPTKEVTMIEFYEKWEPEFLPRGAFKDHPRYGWRMEKKDKEPWAVHFNSGVTIYFKSYSQKLKDLQSGTVDYIACDEELVTDYWEELNFRRTATDGYFSMVFTATLGQEMWRRTMEERGKETEVLPDAHKQSVSLYDCLVYEDDSPSPWTRERIKRIENSCKSEMEVQRRVHGRFVVDEGLKYPGFSRGVNVRALPPVEPADWQIYAGVDIGQGGGKGHPSAIAFVAVRRDYKFARVFRGWRGDYEHTTAGDTFRKYQELKGDMQMMAAFYDWNSKDFFMIATRANEPFVPAEKSHSIGEQVLNVLFKNGMLVIDDIPELDPLVQELATLPVTQPKNRAKDDFIDAVRYAVTKIPWDWSAIKDEIPSLERAVEVKKEPTELELRRQFALGEDEGDGEYTVEQELADWDDLYG